MKCPILLPLPITVPPYPFPLPFPISHLLPFLPPINDLALSSTGYCNHELTYKKNLDT